MLYTFTYIAATEEVSPSPQNDNTGVVVGAVAGLLSVIVIVTGVVLVTYLVLRHKTKGKM